MDSQFQKRQTISEQFSECFLLVKPEKVCYRKKCTRHADIKIRKSEGQYGIYFRAGRLGLICIFRWYGGQFKENGYFGVWVLGTVTAVGGGAVRDVLLGIFPPNMFRHGSASGDTDGGFVAFDG